MRLIKKEEEHNAYLVDSFYSDNIFAINPIIMEMNTYEIFEKGLISNQICNMLSMLLEDIEYVDLVNILE